MTTEIWVAVLALIGTLSGSIGGIIISSKLTNYRLEQLEKKVDRLCVHTDKIPLIERDIDELGMRLRMLEKPIRS